jgi:chromosome segregation ATPase
MMVQKDFNTIIGQIEEDLKNLQSAREQVEKVVTDIAELAKATSSLIDKADEVAKAAKNTLEEQKTENLKTLNQILETHNNIKQLIGQLLDLKIPETLKNINTNLEKENKDIADFRKEVADIETNNLNRFKTTKTLQISILTVVGVFGIVIGLKLFGII